MEADGETPLAGLPARSSRGVRPRLIANARLACMDFRPMAREQSRRRALPVRLRHAVRLDAGSIALQAEEISEHRLAPMTEALALLRKPIRRRVRAVRKRNGAARKQAVVYLENGHRGFLLVGGPARDQPNALTPAPAGSDHRGRSGRAARQRQS